MVRPRSAHRRGFTLIELLVAISILAIVAVLGWRGLDSIVRARIALTNDLEQTRGLQLAFAQLQSDCAHIASAASLPDRIPLAADQQRLIMVRTVFADNQPTRLQVVAYRLLDGILTRSESAATRDLNELDMLWAATTTNTDTARPVALQAGVNAMTIRLWAGDMPGWRVATDAMAPASTPNAAALTGLEVALKLQGREISMTKVFLLGPV